MASQANKDKVVWMLRCILINDPLPGVSVKSVAEKLGMKPDWLRAKFRNDLPVTTTADELLSIMEATGDARVFKLIAPDNICIVDMGKLEAVDPDARPLVLQGMIAREGADVQETFAEVMSDGRVEGEESIRFRRECLESAGLNLAAADYVDAMAVHQPTLGLLEAVK